MTDWEFSIEISTSFYGDLRRTDVTPEGAFREMIDNSTSSYEEHREILDKIEDARKCIVAINWDDEKIEVRDNAFGMNRDGIQRAFQLSHKAEHYSEFNRGEYGLGLKYGALALGSKYTVDSIEYGSGKRLISSLDADYAQEHAPKKQSCRELDAMDNLHGTKITIEGLNEYKYNSYFSKPKTLDTLKKKIAVIYADDLRNNRLDIYFNGEKLSPWDPVWQKDANGNEVFRHFSGEFDHNGKTYQYSGFVGQLSTANVAGAGFSLMQKKRAIEINYRPAQLFGQSNDFRYQRLYGEIQLHGNSWIVSFTKSKLKFEEGIEDLFIQSLNDCKDIKDVQKFAKNFRKLKEGKNMTAEDIKKKQKTLLKPINKPEEKFEPTGVKEPVKYPTNVKPELPLVKEDKLDDYPAFVVPEEKVKEEYTDFKEVVGSVEYTFSVKDDTSKTDGKFYKLIQKNEGVNEYYLYVDSNYGIFDDNTKNGSEKFFNLRLAIKMALAQIVSVPRGVKKSESQIFVDVLNELWRK